MRRRALVLGGVLLLAAFGYWRWTRITPPVTEAEARAYLARLVAAGQARDFERLCNLNGSVLQCEMALRMSGKDAVPPDAPRVTGTRYVPEKDGSVAGRVLVVEGTDGRGKPYRTEVFVFRENRYHFKSINGVYWSGFHLSQSNEVSPDVSTTSDSAGPS